MLYLIGIGLSSKDISLRGIEALKKCKKAYLEDYTSSFLYSVRELEKTINRKVIKINREFVESADILLNESKKQNIALLIYGDPLSATTHIDLVLRAIKSRIKFEIIHSASIFTAAAESGLQLYKFGKTASLPRFYPSFKPESFYDIIKDNLSINAHTLLLLDIGLSVKDALFQIKEVLDRRNEKLNKMLICERLGTKDRKISYGYLEKLIKKNFKVPACIIIPGEMHFLEREFIEKFK